MNRMQMYIFLILSLIISSYMYLDADILFDRLTKIVLMYIVAWYLLIMYKKQIVKIFYNLYNEKYTSSSYTNNHENCLSFFEGDCEEQKYDVEMSESSSSSSITHKNTSSSILEDSIINEEDGIIFWKGLRNRFHDIEQNPNIIIFGAFSMSTLPIVMGSHIVDPRSITLSDSKIPNDSIIQKIRDNKKFQIVSKNELYKLYHAMENADIIIKGSNFIDKTIHNDDISIEILNNQNIKIKENAIVIDLECKNEKTSDFIGYARSLCPSIRFESRFPFMIDLNTAAMNLIMNMMMKSSSHQSQSQKNRYSQTVAY